MVQGRSFGGRCASTGSSRSGRRRRQSRKSLPGYTRSPRPLRPIGQGPRGFPQDSVDLMQRKRAKAVAKYRAARFGNNDDDVYPVAELFEQARLSPQYATPGSGARRSSKQSGSKSASASNRRLSPDYGSPLPVKVDFDDDVFADDDATPGSGARRLSKQSGSKSASASNRRLSPDYGSPLPDKVDFDDDVFADDGYSYVGQDCSFMKFHPNLIKNVYRPKRSSTEDYLECSEPRTREMDEGEGIPFSDFGGFDNPNFSPVVPARKKSERGSTTRTPQSRPLPRRDTPVVSMKVAEDAISPWRFRDLGPRQRNNSGNELFSSPFNYPPRYTSTPQAPQKPIPRTFLGKNVPDNEVYRQPLGAPQKERPRDFVIYEKPLENDETSDEDDDPWADFVPIANDSGAAAQNLTQTPGENGRRLQSVDNVDRSQRRMSLLKSPSPEKRVRRKSYLLSNGVDVSTANTSAANSENLNSLDDPNTDNEQ